MQVSKQLSVCSKGVIRHISSDVIKIAVLDDYERWTGSGYVDVKKARG